MGQRTTSIRTDSIQPTFRGIFLERFLLLIERIDGLDAGAQRKAVCEELVWCAGMPHRTLDQLSYRGMLLVLRDLIGQGWTVRYRQRSIYLSRPDYTRGKHQGLDPAVVKGLIRGAHGEERLARINVPSTVKFIRTLESPPKGKRPISVLIADGQKLASSLRALPSEPTLRELRAGIQPRLQLVRPDMRDETTGLKLTDVWRYFRYLWAIPYQPTPGRNLFYLVRDAAQDSQPVIGIAALGNCVVQLSERDQLIGWSLDAVEQNLARRHRVITRDLPKSASVRRVSETQYLETEVEFHRRAKRYAFDLAATMARSLDHELGLINLKGLATPRECARPTEDLIHRLLSVATASERARQKGLRDSHAKGESARRRKQVTSLARESASPLFVKKRAQALADILFARLQFQRERLQEEPVEALVRLLGSDSGRKSLRIALHANKKTKIGSSMMDIIVCGAIPPYAEMLGGKLVAMLMASPQVVREYREVYESQAGEIASRLAGEPVIRPADLVFLTTTSLYHVGSSQYERIKIPGPRGRTVSFDHIGHTEGYGSIVLSSEATDVLRRVATETHGMRRVNNVFGEGVSPRLRMIREGLALLGIPQDLVLRHNCPRIIYGVRLATNAFEYLRGQDDRPSYVFPPERADRGTEAIIDHWLQRWLAPRSRREESLQKVEAFDPEQIRLSREIRPTTQPSGEECRDAGFD